MRKMLFAIALTGFVWSPQAQAQFGRPQPRLSIKAKPTLRRIPREVGLYRKEANRLNGSCLNFQRMTNRYKVDAQRFSGLANRTPRMRSRYKRLEMQHRQLSVQYQKLTNLCQTQQRQLRQAASAISRQPNILPATKGRMARGQRDLQKKISELQRQSSSVGNTTRSSLRQINRDMHQPNRGPIGSPAPPSRNNRPNALNTSKIPTGPKGLKLGTFSISRLNINAPSSYQSRAGSLLRSKESAFRQCYVSELGKLNKPQSASFSLAFQIKQDGKVTSNRVVRWPSDSFRAAICMRDVINALNFPLPPSSTIVIEMDILVRTSR
ncbi:MAG: hypothetical protein H6728_12155 [Myxococcales bacterium]|nr:hypothetical protein [Myxococcales bacterium]MCB9643818.1 hypothetical protein [Myxococcales bacterium]